MYQQFSPLLYTISVWALPAIIAITFHEAAHGFVARLLGDDTAWRLGRVTFNPLKHIDPIGTILLPGMLAVDRPKRVQGFVRRSVHHGSAPPCHGRSRYRVARPQRCRSSGDCGGL